MQKLQRILVLVVELLLCGSQLTAGETSKAKYAGEFLSTGVGARALALGGAYTAIASDVTAVYWNPAGLAQLNNPEAMLMHAQRFSGIIQYNFAALAVPYGGESTLGIGVIRLGIDDIIKTKLPRPDLRLGDVYEDDGRQFRNTPVQDYTFSNAEYGFFFSYGKQHSEKLGYGANFKILHKGFDSKTAWGMGIDVGATYRLRDNVLLGANFQDGTTTILAWNTGTKELIVPTLKLGVATPFYLSLLSGNFMPIFDVDVRFEGREFSAQAATGAVSFDFHTGLEYDFKRKLALRIGSDTGNLTAGAGIRFEKFIIDYAFMNHTELEETHRLSLRLPFENSRYQRK